MDGPVDRGERIAAVDALRGFALLGILLVNMDTHAGPWATSMIAPDGGVDRLASLFTTFAAEGKFYPLFSMLFGFGLAIQSGRAADRTAFAWRWTRRQLALLLFGLLHVLLLWPGDILTTYAAVGMLLLPFMLVPQRALPWIAAGAWAIGGLMVTALFALIALAAAFVPEVAQEMAAAGAETLAEGEAARAVYARGTFAEIVSLRATEFTDTLVVGVLSAPTIFSMFVLGLWAGRAGIAADPAAHATLLRRVALVCLPTGLLFAAVTAATAARLSLESFDVWFTAQIAASLFGGPLLAIAYASLFLRHAPARVVSLLAPAGRMALTNYLAQSLVCAALFQAWGLGLYGSLGDAAELALSVAIFAAQVAWSHLWMRSFRFGPMEWLWRAITYRGVAPRVGAAIG